VRGIIKYHYGQWCQQLSLEHGRNHREYNREPKSTDYLHSDGR
jgi:hypothetical protein